MCGIYGVLSYKDKLKDMNELVDLLGMESAERGTDATGVAYSILGNMKINKSAVSAYKFNPNIPKFVNAVIGHTRHSTQGDKSKNYNNHPWSERVKNCQFALAHNGVLFNDKELQKKVGTECYDIVVANILADVIIPMAPVIPARLKKGGYFITSGIIDFKENEVKEAIEKAGLEVVEINHQGEWVNVTARKN